jgi:shikimate 5-dehydrogenase
MLVYQGAEAFRLWTGQEAPAQVMMEAAKSVLEKVKVEA